MMVLNDQFATQEYTRPGFLISTDASRLDVQVIHHYLANESYWAKGVSIDIVRRSLQYSLCFGVYAIEKEGHTHQVGLARVMSDFATFAYIADVFILPEFQGQGLGTWLVRSVLEYPAFATLRRFTLDTADAHGLYKKFGFEVNPTPEKHMIYQPNRVEE